MQHCPVSRPCGTLSLSGVHHRFEPASPAILFFFVYAWSVYTGSFANTTFLSEKSLSSAHDFVRFIG